MIKQLEKEKELSRDEIHEYIRENTEVLNLHLPFLTKRMNELSYLLKKAEDLS